MFYSPITDYDIYLFKEGTHTRLYRKLGAHLIEGGCHFAVWAPFAREVYVSGDFNGWDKFSHPMNKRWDPSGIWDTLWQSGTGGCGGENCGRGGKHACL
jgi:1,4-alpha-glucan branching enzyme